jgi:hypothetical protein
MTEGDTVVTVVLEEMIISLGREIVTMRLRAASM